MAFNTKPLVTDLNGKPSPQYFNPDADSYEVVEGYNGAIRVILIGRQTHASVETTATTTESTATFDVDYISMISNDGTDDILFNFDANTSAAGTITLKAGEVLSDFPRACNVLYFKAKSGSQPFRAWGVK